MTREKLNAIINALITIRDAVDDTIALSAKDLYPDWREDTLYTTGDRVRYADTLYKCLQSHTAQPTWTPSDAPSLWVRIDDPAIEWPEWIQPVGSTDAYPMGAKVSHNGSHWTSTIDGNVWEPGVYGWVEV